MHLNDLQVKPCICRFNWIICNATNMFNIYETRKPNNALCVKSNLILTKPANYQYCISNIASSYNLLLLFYMRPFPYGKHMGVPKIGSAIILHFISKTFSTRSSNIISSGFPCLNTVRFFTVII